MPFTSHFPAASQRTIRGKMASSVSAAQAKRTAGWTAHVTAQASAHAKAKAAREADAETWIRALREKNAAARK